MHIAYGVHACTINTNMYSCANIVYLFFYQCSYSEGLQGLQGDW